MISVDKAKNIIHAQLGDWGVEKKSILEAIGEQLAEPIHADRDFPPFDRVMMDGIAINSNDFDEGVNFPIQGVQLAGEPPMTLKRGCAIEIMTGAVLPIGADVAVRYEDLDIQGDEGSMIVTILLSEIKEGNHIHFQGTDRKSGDPLVSEGVLITSAEVSIMATVGVESVLIRKKPKVAVISTGDELVDVGSSPAPFQIRKSNVVAIQAMLIHLNFECQSIHLNDDKKNLETELKVILDQYDVVILSGGVSKGKADYLPEVLSSLGVKKEFHRVAQRPGKPFWFGRTEEAKPVFAFPGNPVATAMCFRVYCLPWIYKSLGFELHVARATLMEDVKFKPDLGCFLQVKTNKSSDETLEVFPVKGNGSGDLANLAESDAFLLLPAGRDVYKSAEKYEYISFSADLF